jgi:hypothetical protein
LPLGYLIGRLVVVAWLLPLYFRGEVFTAYQVLSERFGGTVRKLASVLFLVTRTLADGLRLYLTALVVQALLPISLPAAVAAMGRGDDRLYLLRRHEGRGVDRRAAVRGLHGRRHRRAHRARRRPARRARPN